VPLAGPTAVETPSRRVGLVYRSGRPADSAWSGIPAGLGRGLSELGFEPYSIDAEPRRTVTRAAKAWAAVVHRNRHGGLFAPEIRELRRVTARMRASHLGTFEAVIQMGSDFGIPFSRALATYEDMTVLQRARVDSIESILGTVAVSRWVAAQQRCYDAAAACCAMSSAAANSIVDDYGMESSKVHVVWAGRNYDPKPVERDWTRPRFFFMGYDWERKNGPLVLRAFTQLRSHIENVRLDVAGHHPRLDLDGVRAHGPLDLSDAHQRAKAEQLFQSATCFVMPSRYEPFGIVYVEAAAAGVPSIGTRVGGASDAIGPNGGLLVDPNDEGALVEAMEVMCDPAKAAAMGAAALERSHLFTWASVAQRIMGALNRPMRSDAHRT
jgi:glycosyltransferase involved in cell wall biosynthesis